MVYRMLSISQLAKKAETTIDTIRFYEKKGLLLPRMKAMNNYRYYDQGSLDKLSFILNCRSLGISIKDIESLCEELETPNQNCTKVNNLIKKHTKELDNKIKQLTSFKKQLDDLENLCGDNRKIENCYIIKKLEMNS